MDLVAWRGIVTQYRATIAPLDVVLAPAGNTAPAAVFVDPPAERRALTDRARQTIGNGLLEAALCEVMEAGGKITDLGLEAVCGPLDEFFSKGFECATRSPPGIDRAEFQALLRAVLADEIPAFRYRRGENEPQLANLTPEQRAEWMTPKAITSISLDPGSAEIFRARVTEAAQLASAALTALEPTLGTLAAARETQLKVVQELRALDRNSPEWALKGQEANHNARRVQLLANLTEASLLTEGADPARVAKLQKWLIPRDENFRRTLETADLKFTSGETYEDPPFAERFNNSAIVCLQWPDAAVLSECTDANKHMLCTRDPKYGIVQGSLRLVARQDGANKNKPLLVLERLYPDCAVDAKRRLIEHAIERSRALKIPLALPEEYFWSCDRFQRYGLTENLTPGTVQIPNMNEEIKDLAKTKKMRLMESLVLRVKAVMGPFGSEYIDSAPLGGAADRGVAQERKYSKADTYYNNQFAVLVPRGARP